MIKVVAADEAAIVYETAEEFVGASRCKPVTFRPIAGQDAGEIEAEAKAEAESAGKT